MFRDFSDEAKEKLLTYVKEAAPEQSWGNLAELLAGIKYSVWEWLLELDLTGSISDLEGYQQRMIEKHQTTKDQIEKIFAEEKEVDSHYGTVMGETVEQGKRLIKFIEDLADTIDPSGGNFTVAHMDDILAADKEAVETGKSSMEQVIEQEMQGLEALGADFCGDPVNTSTGNYIYDHKDLEIKGDIPLSFHRYYNAKDNHEGSLGKSFIHNYEIKLKKNGDGTIAVRMSDGRILHYEKTKDGTYVGRNTALETIKESADGYLLHRNGKGRMRFDREGKILRQEENGGRGIAFTYNDKKQLTEARTDSNSAPHYTYDNKGKLIKVTDHGNRELELTYEKDRLATVKEASGAVYTYRYAKNGKIKEIINARNQQTVYNSYDDKNRVTHQKFPDGGEMFYAYDDDKNCVTFTERNKSKTVYVHDDKLRHTKTIYEDGTKETYIYNDKNQCICMTDRNGNTKRMAYDRRGNLTQVTDATKRRTNLTYDANNHLINISINGKERIKNHYDAHGNLIGSENITGSEIKITNDAAGRPVTIKKPDGSCMQITYDARGNISCLKEATGTENHYTYDTWNRVTETKDGNGNKTYYTYDAADRITNVRNAAGDTRAYRYNESGKVTLLQDFDGYEIGAVYNGMNRMETITDKEGNKTYLSYDVMGNVAQERFADGAARSYRYNKENKLETITLPSGGTITYTYDAVGNCIGIKDAAGNRTAFTYDAANRMTEKIEPDGAKTSYVYDNEGNLKSATDALGGITSYTYDEMGQRTSVTDVLGNTTSVYYNRMGNIERICYPNGSSMTYTYEAGGRIAGVTNPDGTSEHYHYDKNGNLIQKENGLGETTILTYDCLNRITSVTNPLGGKRQYTYDAAGHMTTLTDENGNTTTYEYSPNGNLTKVTDALGGETRYEYDCMNRLIKTEQGGTMQTAEAYSMTYARDIAGNITAITDALGAVEHYEYDQSGRVTAKRDRDGYTTTLSYDHAGKVTDILYADGRAVKMTYNALHQLEEMKDWLGITKIELDALGHPLHVTDPEGNITGYEWGNMGERTALHYPDGSLATYEYDRAMHLIALHTGENTVNYRYDETGRLKEKQLPSGITTTYAYNPLGRIAEITHVGDGVSEQYSYTYDVAGNKTGMQTMRDGMAETNGSYAYTYDALNRLIEVKKENERLREYRYDAFGNRIEKKDYTKTKEAVIRYTYNQGNQLIEKSQAGETQTYAYDRRGNLQTVYSGVELLKQFTYDAANRMQMAQTAITGKQEQTVYSYNGFGQRIGQESPERNIRYSLDVTKQYKNLLTMQETTEGKTFYWDDSIVCMDTEGTKNFYLQDDLGSPMQLLDETGNICETYAYDEFGAAINVAGIATTNTVALGSPLQPFGFTGYQMEQQSGLYFAEARRYDAETGRFTSEDKVRGFAEKPHTLNPYTYCWNKPTDLVDLNGLYPTTEQPVGARGISWEVSALVVPPVGANAAMVMDCASVCDSEGNSQLDEMEDYAARTIEHVIYGNLSDEVTALGVGIDVTLGIFGLDVIQDVRDLIADIYLGVTGQKTGWELAGSIVIGIIALIPLVGIVKYSDEVVTLVKRVPWDEIGEGFVDVCGTAFKHGGDAITTGWKAVVTKLDEFADGVSTWAKQGDEILDEITKNSDEITGGVVAGIAKNGDEVVEGITKSSDEITEGVVAGVTKQEDEILDEITKNSDEIAGGVAAGIAKNGDEVVEGITKSSDEITEGVVAGVTKQEDEILDEITKNSDEIAGGVAAGIAKNGDEVVEGITKNSDAVVKGVAECENEELGEVIEGGLNSERVEYYLNKSRNNMDSDTVILGSTGKYDVIAENEGYTYFKMSDDVWASLEREAANNYDEIWKVNQQFIDEQIATNKNILLSNDPYKGYYFSDGTRRFYQREIDYITSKGYTFEETTDGLWRAIRK